MAYHLDQNRMGNCHHDHITIKFERNKKKLYLSELHWEKYIFISCQIEWLYDRGISFPFDFEPNRIPFFLRARTFVSGL